MISSLIAALKVRARKLGLWSLIIGEIDVAFTDAINVKRVTKPLDPFTGIPIKGVYNIHFTRSLGTSNYQVSVRIKTCE